MRQIRHTAVAAILASLFGASAAQAGGQYQLDTWSPGRIVPIMDCEIKPFGNGWALYVFNEANVPYTLPAGTQIHWSINGGQNGFYTLGTPLDAGHGILVDVVPTYQRCSAQVA